MTEQLKQLREAFERWAPSVFSRRTTVDEDGYLSYDDDWMQGAWAAYVELTTSQPAQATHKAQVDEREDFEKWWKGDLTDWQGHSSVPAAHAWSGWQARASFIKREIK
jgi:hypothetical protein